MRGAYVGHDNGLTGAERFIPTYVGHTCRRPFSLRLPAVHPHIRGAYPSRALIMWTKPGSSPHTWGIHLMFPRHYWSHRFIPTYVGHTPRCPALPGPRPVHPHIRGAYAPGPARSQRFIWFIPTYVGHTFWNDACRASIAVHPHIRGAYFLLTERTVEIRGSSPHTWGILLAGKFFTTRSRFIPTYVGHTRPGRAHTRR